MSKTQHPSEEFAVSHNTTRRGFLKAGTAAVCLGHAAQGFGDPEPTTPVWQAAKVPSEPAEAQSVRCANEQGVPVIAEAQVLVVGSHLQGCFLAERLANRGKNVVLAAADTSLPREMAIALRPWIKRRHLEDAPADMRAFLQSCAREEVGDDWILNMVALTTGLEDRLLDAGAGLYYDLQPCGVQLADRDVVAVLFASKGSLVAIEAQAIVDGTPDARVARWAGAGFVHRDSAAQGIVARYSMLCNRPRSDASLRVEGVPELLGGRVLLHADFIEFQARLPVAPSLIRESTYGLEMRRIAAETGRALKESGVWPEAAFVRGGDIVLCDPIERIVGRDAGDGLSVDACRPREIDNLLVCGPAADVPDAIAQMLVESVAGPSLADVLVQAPWPDLFTSSKVSSAAHAPSQSHDRGGPDDAKVVRLSNTNDTAASAATGQARFEELRPIYWTGRHVPIDGTILPVVAQCQVLVAGGGTSGAPAATIAAAQGLDTLVIDKYGDVGGTHTIGGVPKYWFGRHTEFVQQLDRQAAGMMDQTGMPKCMGMLNNLIQAGAGLLRGTAAGTVVEGDTVVGGVFATPDGLVVVKAQHVIDATGDGDLAAWAGAATDYGTCHDAMTMWDNFAHYRGTNPEAARHFDCAFDLRDPADLTRGIISSRRRGAGRDARGFPQYYLTPRESRHIRGRATVTYEGILGRRRFHDVVLVALSNFDIKGIACSDHVFAGYVDWDYSRNHPAPIPYRALVPERLEGILVIGKAYSCTHDALSLARMQRDLMAMGGVAGLAATQAIRTERALSEIDIEQLQSELVRAGILTWADIHADRLEARVTGWQAGGTILTERKGPPVADQQWPELSAADLQRAVRQMAAGKLLVERAVDILVRRDAALPLLRQALPSASGDGQIEIARALCFLDDAAGAETLLAELDRELAGDQLPAWEHRRHDMPDHGWAPSAAYLIFLLARLGDRRVIARMETVADKVRMNPARSDAMFCYVHAVCLAADHLAHADCLDALNTLADKPGMKGSDLPIGADPRQTVDPTADRYAYLELCIGRALARCGSPRGQEILARYARDLRGVLARSAQALS